MTHGTIFRVLNVLFLLFCVTILQADLLLRLDVPDADPSGVWKLPAELTELLAATPRARITPVGHRLDPHFPVLHLTVPATVRESDWRATLAASAGIRWAAPNRLLSVEDLWSQDSLSSEQWALGWLRAEEAWQLEESNREVLLAIVDTGLLVDHPDLSGRLWCNPGEDLAGDGCWRATSNGIELDPADLNGIDDDGNGLIDDLCGYDFVDSPGRPVGGDDLVPDPLPLDEHGHGTLVTGVAAAVRGNGIGIAGISNSCRVVPLRVANRLGFVEEDDLASALLYAIDLGVDVVNLSLGDDAGSPLLEDLVEYAVSQGVLLVASAGNTGDTRAHYPSDYPGVIAVGAATQAAGGIARAGFSSHGPGLDLLAPGQQIMSCDLNGGWSLFGGTSAAAPFVSAGLAMALARDPDLLADELPAMLRLSCLDMGPDGPDDEHGAGLLDLRALLEERRAPRLELHAPPHGLAVDPSTSDPLPLVLTARGDAHALLLVSLLDPAGSIRWQLEVEQALHRDTLDWLDPLLLDMDGDWELSLELELMDRDRDVLRRRFRVDATPPRVLDSTAGWRWWRGLPHLAVSIRLDDPVNAGLVSLGVPVQPAAAWLDDSGRHHRLLPSQAGGPLAWQLENGTGWSALQDIDTLAAPPATPLILQPSWRDAGLPVGRALVLPREVLPDGRAELLLAQETDSGALLELALWSAASPTGEARKHYALPRPLYPVALQDRDGDLLLLASAGGECRLYQLGPDGAEELAQFAGVDAVRFLPATEEQGLRLLLRSRAARPAYELWRWEQGAGPTLLADLGSSPLERPSSWDAASAEWADLDANGRPELWLADAGGQIWALEEQSDTEFDLRFAFDLGTEGPGRAMRSVADSQGRPSLWFSTRRPASEEHSPDPGLWTLGRVVWEDEAARVEWLQAGAGEVSSAGMGQGLVQAGNGEALLLASWPGLLRLDAEGAVTAWLEAPGNDAYHARQVLEVDGRLLVQRKRVTPGADPWVLLELPDNEATLPPAWSAESRALSAGELHLAWNESAATDLRLFAREQGTEPLQLLATVEAAARFYRDTLAAPGLAMEYALQAGENGDESSWGPLGALLGLQGEDPPRLDSVRWMAEPGWLRLRFDRPLRAGDPAAETCTFVDPQGNSVAVASLWNPAPGSELIVLPAGEDHPAGSWRLLLAPVRSRAGAESAELEIGFELERTGILPAILSATAVDSQTLELRFSTAMDPGPLQNPVHYRFEPPRRIASLQPLDQAGTLRMGFSAMESLVPGTAILLRTNGLVDAGGRPLAGEAARILWGDWAARLKTVSVHPAPWRADRHDPRGPSFSGLPPGSRLLLYDLQGRLLQELQSTTGLALNWDLELKRGGKANSGVYLWLAIGPDGVGRKEGKVVIIR